MFLMIGSVEGIKRLGEALTERLDSLRRGRKGFMAVVYSLLSVEVILTSMYDGSRIRCEDRGYDDVD